MNTIDEAEKTAEQLKQLIEKTGNRKFLRHYHHLMGTISLAHGRIPDAEQEFLAAISGLSSHMYTFYYHSLFVEALASVYYKTQDSAKAQREYERIMSFPYGRIHFGDIYAKSFYILGKINDENGSKSKAIEHFQKFLDLWKDADPGIAELKDARKRLAGLVDN
jgi:tetratricopeptide (TPR) repeat protein